MTDREGKSQYFDELRTRAEKLLKRKHILPPKDWPEDFKKLFHELETHQIELEIQNEELRRAHEELAASRDRFADLYDFSPAGYVTLTDKGRIRRANLTLARMLGVSKERLTGRHLSGFVAAEDQDKLYRSFKNLLREKKRQSMELRLQKDEGEPFLARLDCIPVTGGRQDGPIDVRVVVSDITERKRDEAALAESEARLRAMFHQAAVGVIIAQAGTGRLLEVNHKFCDIVGYSAAELLTKTFHEITHPGDLQLNLDRMRKVEAGELRDYSMEKRYIRKDGSALWVHLTASPMWKVGEKPTFFVAIAQDITERKAMEEALKESNYELEKRVAARTAKLVHATLKMEQEIHERREKEKALLQSEAKLAQQKGELEETNTALKVILKKREFDRQEIEEQVMANVKGLVAPYVEKLKKTALSDEQQNYVGIIESNLNDIVASFVRSVSSKYLKLTPMEIQVANLVKQGKSTKEIANLMNLSVCTINVHRRHIRKKLGLSSKKKNLQTFLAAKA